VPGVQQVEAPAGSDHGAALGPQPVHDLAHVSARPLIGNRCCRLESRHPGRCRDRAGPSGRDEPGGRLDCCPHCLRRVGPVAERDGGGDGEPVPCPADVGVGRRDRREFGHRDVAALAAADEQPRSTGADRDAQRRRAPTRAQRLERSVVTGEVACLGLVGRDEHTTGDRRLPAGMRIPYDGDRRRGFGQRLAQRGQRRHPAAVVGDADRPRAGDGRGHLPGQGSRDHRGVAVVDAQHRLSPCPHPGLGDRRPRRRERDDAYSAVLQQVPQPAAVRVRRDARDQHHVLFVPRGQQRGQTCAAGPVPDAFGVDDGDGRLGAEPGRGAF
jgi:hypothetical protein